MPKLMPTKWSGKEIGVTIGYAFLLLLCYFASDCLGFFGPFFWVYGVPIMLLVAGIPYFYIAAREPRYGTFTIVGVLFLLLLWLRFVVMILFGGGVLNRTLEEQKLARETADAGGEAD